METTPFSRIELFILDRHAQTVAMAHEIIDGEVVVEGVRNPLNYGGEIIAEVVDTENNIMLHLGEGGAGCRCDGNNLVAERNMSTLGFFNPERCLYLLAVARTFSDHPDFDPAWSVFADAQAA